MMRSLPGFGRVLGSDDGGVESEGLEMGTEEFFSLMRNPRRRALIKYLDKVEECGRSQLTRAVASDEHGVDMEDVIPTEEDSISASLSQTHLPRLEDMGLVVRKVGPAYEATDELHRCSELLRVVEEASE